MAQSRRAAAASAASSERLLPQHRLLLGRGDPSSEGSGRLVVRDTSFRSNEGSHADAGAIYQDAATAPALIERCSFKENGALGDGGAIRLRSGVVASSMFDGNTALRGGALVMAELAQARRHRLDVLRNSASQADAILGLDLTAQPTRVSYVRGSLFRPNSSSGGAAVQGKVQSDGGNVFDAAPFAFYAALDGSDVFSANLGGAVHHAGPDTGGARATPGLAPARGSASEDA